MLDCIATWYECTHDMEFGLELSFVLTLIVPGLETQIGEERGEQNVPKVESMHAISWSMSSISGEGGQGGESRELCALETEAKDVNARSE